MRSFQYAIIFLWAVIASAQENSTHVNGTTPKPSAPTTTENATTVVHNTTMVPIDNTTLNNGNETTLDYGNDTTTAMPLWDNTTAVENTTREANETQTKPPPVPETCVLPEDLIGVWWSTIWAGLTVTSDREMTVTFRNGKEAVFNCTSMGPSGHLIMAMTPESVLPDNSTENSTSGLDDVIYYTCIKFQRRNKNNFQVQIQTERNKKLNNQPLVAVVADEEAPDAKLVCNGLSSKQISGDLLRKDHEKDGALGCPEILRGEFDVTFSDLTSSMCPEGAYMTSCEDPKTLEFDFSMCTMNLTEAEKNGMNLTEAESKKMNLTQTESNKTLSGDDKSLCVAGGYNHVTTFKEDLNNGSSPFECLEASEAAKTVEVVSKPDGCGGTWFGDKRTDNYLEYSLLKTAACAKGVYSPPTPKPQSSDGDKPKNAGTVLEAYTLLVSIAMSMFLVVVSL